MKNYLVPEQKKLEDFCIENNIQFQKGYYNHFPIYENVKNMKNDFLAVYTNFVFNKAEDETNLKLFCENLKICFHNSSVYFIKFIDDVEKNLFEKYLKNNLKFSLDFSLKYEVEQHHYTFEEKLIEQNLEEAEAIDLKSVKKSIEESNKTWKRNFLSLIGYPKKGWENLKEWKKVWKKMQLAEQSPSPFDYD